MLAIRRRLHWPASVDSEPRGPRWLRWLARGFGTLIGGVVLFWMAAEAIATYFFGWEEENTIGEPTTNPSNVEWVALITLVVAALGLLVAWRRAGAGAAITLIAGFIGFVSLPRSFPVIMLFWMAALLHLFAWLTDRDERVRQEEPGGTDKTPTSGWV